MGHDGRLHLDVYKRQVLVYMMDRFSRSEYDAPIYKKELAKHGVEVVSAMEALPDLSLIHICVQHETLALVHHHGLHAHVPVIGALAWLREEDAALVERLSLIHISGLRGRGWGKPPYAVLRPSAEPSANHRRAD